MRLTKEKTKIYFIPNDPDRGNITIKHIKPHTIRKIESQTNEVVYNAGETGDGSTSIKFDPYGRSKLLALECITAWDNILSTTGKKMELNPTNVGLAAEFEITMVTKADEEGEDDIEEVVDFFTWVADCRRDLAEEVAAQKKVAAEN